MSNKKIEDVIKEHTDKLMVLPYVIGIGKGESNGNPCIIIFVQDKEVTSLEVIPDTIEGYPIIINKSGDFIPHG